MDRPTCKQCDTVVPGFVQIDTPWLGNPVLYMGRDALTNMALVYHFCTAECLIEWLGEVLGMEVS